MSREQQRGEGGADPATEMQLALVQEGTREVEEVWEAPITEELKKWTTDCLKKRLREKHEGKLTAAGGRGLGDKGQKNAEDGAERGLDDEGVGSRLGVGGA